MLNKLREDISLHTSDPSSIPRIRRTLSQASSDIILLMEVLGYLEECVTGMENPPFPKDVQVCICDFEAYLAASLRVVLSVHRILYGKLTVHY